MMQYSKTNFCIFIDIRYDKNIWRSSSKFQNINEILRKIENLVLMMSNRLDESVQMYSAFLSAILVLFVMYFPAKHMIVHHPKYSPAMSEYQFLSGSRA